jgi:CheY-like chemotaxis protein
MQGPVRLPEGKVLTIRTGIRENSAFIEIEDNGAGIPPDMSEKIFQPFFTTKEPGRGTGLGLSISRQIVREHEGDITLQSRPGRGTVFALTFPLARDEEFDSIETLATPTPYEAVPGKKILVADDETDIAAVIARLMREDGDEVSVAHNGAEALKLLEAGRYDLVITDIEMEHAKGTDLYAALADKGALASCRMLFVTGDILNAKVLEFLSKTNSEYLVKPFDIQELRQTARRLLRQPAR